MNLIIVGGFLGSGKTTLLLSIAKYLTEIEGLKIAIVENEIGKVGVDGSFLKEQGLEIKEIYSGCICCSLRTDIIQTLLELERSFEPDVVLLEPSGVANPTEVIRCLDGYGGNIEGKQMLTIIDPVRFSKLHDYSLPLISNSIKLANLVVINKIDLVDSSDVSSVEERIKQINDEVKIIGTSALKMDNLKDIYESLKSKIVLEQPAIYTIVQPQVSMPSHDGAVHYAKEVEVQFDPPISNNEIEERLHSFLSNVALNLQKSRCDLIGHLKVIVKEKNKGYLVASKTSFEHPPQIKGKLAKSMSSLKIILNLIVYSIGKEELQTIAEIEIRKMTQS